MHERAANHPGNTAEPKPTCGNPPPEVRARLAAQCEKVSDTFTSTDYDSGCASVSDTGSVGARSRLEKVSDTPRPGMDATSAGARAAEDADAQEEQERGRGEG